MISKQHSLLTFLLISLFFNYLPLHASSVKLDKAKKTYEKDLIKAKENYEKNLKVAKSKLIKSYDEALSAAMQNADLDLANKINREKKEVLGIKSIDKEGNGEEPIADFTPSKPSSVPEGSAYFNKNWYYFHPDTLSFSRAQALAKKMRGRLVVISSREENGFIFKNMKGHSWLDLVYVPIKTSSSESSTKKPKKLVDFGGILNNKSKPKKASWKVMGRYNPPFLNWREGYPYTSSYRTTYAYLSKYDEGKWKSNNSTEANYFVVLEFGKEKKFLGN